MKNQNLTTTTGRRAQINEAVSVVRRHRAAHLGMPSVRPVLPSPRTEASA